jgi:hypothetical protein
LITRSRQALVQSWLSAHCPALLQLQLLLLWPSLSLLLLLLLPAQPRTISMRTGDVMAIFSLPWPAAVLLPKMKLAICGQKIKQPAADVQPADVMQA